MNSSQDAEPVAAVHAHHLRIYFEDTDAGGIVYHANYLRYAERGRSEALRALGMPHAEMMRRHQRMFVVRRAKIDYERPARLDDCLRVETRTLALTGASVTLDQTIKRADQVVLVRIELLLACVGVADGRAARLPGDMRAALEKMRQAGDPDGGSAARHITGGAAALEGF
jgi:acyl-CoA thioester hydrolase